VQKQRRALLVDDEVGLRNCAAIAEIHGRHDRDRGAGAAEKFHDLVSPPRRRVGDRREVRPTSVDVGTPFEELPYESFVGVLRSHRERRSVPPILGVRIDTRDKARGGPRVTLPKRLAELRNLVHRAQRDCTRSHSAYAKSAALGFDKL
jgi:hypothetical protein